MPESKKDKGNDKAPEGLSEQDAALWQKVVDTLDTTASATRKSANKTPDQKHNQTTASQKEIIHKAKNAALSPTTEEFKALLENQPSETKKTAKPSKVKSVTQNPAKTSQPKKPKTPKIETFNQRDARNISSGKQTIDAAIDLHGLTQRQAETALKTFLKRAHLDEKRTVLVITGKGQKRDHHERSFELGAPEPGIIRRSVPNWLDDMPEIVISYTTSHSKHGGEGALYVRLRRPVKTSR